MIMLYFIAIFNKTYKWLGMQLAEEFHALPAESEVLQGNRKRRMKYNSIM